jgi:hypothetical protein
VRANHGMVFALREGMKTTSLVAIAFSSILGSTLVGCAVPTAEEGVGGEVADEAVAGDALTGTGTIGEKLVTTTRVNFRSAASTSSSILRVLSKDTSVTLLKASPQGVFYNVQVGSEKGFVHGSYLARASAGGGGNNGGGNNGGGSQDCSDRKLTFSADNFPSVPAGGSAMVWGGNATGGADVLYSDEFVAKARSAQSRGIPVFAYLEGPCGDTGGVDDGERARCQAIHRKFNRNNAPSTPDTALARWKPYTFQQMKDAKANGVDFCEIDNLNNNVNVPLIPLAKEIKRMYDAGTITCRLVLKNVPVDEIDDLKSQVAPTPADADFIAPFHIFEADDTSEKSRLDAAMVRLKGQGAKTIISTDTNAYGSAFTRDTFKVCK